MAYFPMYVELKNAPCLVVGGGKVALRKVQVLKEFEAKVTVIAPQMVDEISQMRDIKKIVRCFDAEDIDGMTLVVTATDEAVQNHEIAKQCKEQKIPVNAVDQVEDCTFIFPSYVKQGEVTAAITSGGQSPIITQYMKKKIKEVMPKNLGEMADALGGIREQVKDSLATEAERKRLYTFLLEQMLEQNEVFSEADMDSYIMKIKRGE